MLVSEGYVLVFESDVLVPQGDVLHRGSKCRW